MTWILRKCLVSRWWWGNPQAPYQSGSAPDSSASSRITECRMSKWEETVEAADSPRCPGRGPRRGHWLPRTLVLGAPGSRPGLASGFQLHSLKWPPFVRVGAGACHTHGLCVSSAIVPALITSLPTSWSQECKSRASFLGGSQQRGEGVFVSRISPV